MKKMTLCIMCAVFILLGLLSLSAAAANSVCIADTNSVKVGEQISVTVSLEGCSAVKTMGITPVYDNTVFELVSTEWTVKDGLIGNFDEEKGNGALVFAQAKDCNGQIFLMKFKAKDGALSGQHEIKAEMIIMDSENKSIDCTSAGAVITVLNGGSQATAPAESEDKVPDETKNINETADISSTDAVTGTTSPVKDFIAEEDAEEVPPEPDGGLNGKIFLWGGIAVAVCVVLGLCFASIKKQQ